MVKRMDFGISYDRSKESMIANARWFQSLSLSERAELLCQFTDLILAVNPKVVEQKSAEPIEGRILVLTIK